jgi:Ser/Thr protein kinase RdoA (MazF antagonist)
MMGDVETDVVARACEAFDLGSGDVSVTSGSRGALGQVWHVEVGHRVYALKEVFAGSPPAESVVAAEIAFAERAVAAGVRVPASYPDRDGRYLVPQAGGGWWRLYEWVDLRRADVGAAAKALGTLVARLHGCAQDSDRELDGSEPDPWYEQPPELDGWSPLVTAATEHGQVWATRLAALVDRLPSLHGVLSPAEPAVMIRCHRDLHPENVLADRAGDLWVVDWDDLGPAVPARELARTLMTCFHDESTDLGSLLRAYTAYVEAGGPARLSTPSDFTMLIATQLNFLQRQVEVALDPAALTRDRDWAALEIDESLRTMPTPELLGSVLETLDG